MSAVAAIVLAAGRSTRMGAANKLLCPVDGRPMVVHAVAAALASRARPVVVVTGHEAEAVEAVLPPGVTAVRNADHASGIASSLRCGLAALPEEVAATVVLLGDMPRVGAVAIDRLVALFEEAPHVAAVAPTWRGEPANPVLIARRLFAEVMRLEGDQGARRLFAGRGDVLTVATDDPAMAIDIDTPEALAALAARDSA
ncbi:MAG: nucleotidyltransferase family protein [Pseudomonadota bacterium]|nr:MAG: 4-diphosphocytidyl-2C-methyl-D-erythritol kinase [Pseudomonadota bacterium]